MKRNNYKDILVIVIGFTAIGLIFNIPYMVYAVLGIGVLCIFSETIAKWVAKGWMSFGMFLGKINSTILLGLVFVLMLTPLAILKRLTGKKADVQDDSNWTMGEEKPVNFEKPW